MCDSELSLAHMRRVCVIMQGAVQHSHYLRCRPAVDNTAGRAVDRHVQLTDNPLYNYNIGSVAQGCYKRNNTISGAHNGSFPASPPGQSVVSSSSSSYNSVFLYI